MCRHAGYVGNTIPLRQFLTEPSHSLVIQSYKPKEMISATLNADGYGVGWVEETGDVGRYTNPMPIWGDSNLESLGRAISSEIWIGNVRSATPGLPVSQANTHPFSADGMLFSHNGFVTDFAKTLRPIVREWLMPGFDAAIQGTTDSEYLFAVMRQLMAETGQRTTEAFAALVDQLRDWIPDVPVLLNLLVADREGVAALRYAQNHESPSLYCGRDDDVFGDGWLVASEPMTDGKDWRAVDPGSVVVLHRDNDPIISRL